MARIAERTEESLNYDELLKARAAFASPTVTDAISYATCTTAQDLGAAAIHHLYQIRLYGPQRFQVQAKGPDCGGYPERAGVPQAMPGLGRAASYVRP